MNKILPIIFTIVSFCSYGQKLLKDINLGKMNSSPYVLCSNDSSFIFTANSEKGLEPWISDGTPQGTRLIKDINAGSGSSNILVAISIEGFGYLMINNRPGSFPMIYEIWRSDGTDSGTILLNDEFINYPIPSSKQAIMYKDKLYFTGTHPLTGTELWISDGTRDGTTLFKDIFPGSTGSNPRGFTLLNDKLYFFATTDSLGNELWVSDGSDTGTHIVTDLFPGSGNGIETNKQFNIIDCNNRIFFAGSRGDSTGYELNITDGTAQGTALFKEFTEGTLINSSIQLTKFNDSIFFVQALDNNYIFHVWRYSRKDGKLTELKYKNTGDGENLFYGAYALKENNVYYLYQLANGRELWTEQPDINNLDLLINNKPGPGSGCCTISPIIANGIAYYSTANAVGQDIWKTDGNTDHTKTILNLTPEQELSGLLALKNHLLIFGKLDSLYGNEIYYLDINSSVTTHNQKNYLSVYPNPVKSGSIIRPYQPEEILSLNIYDLSGKCVSACSGTVYEYLITLDPGIYTIQINYGNRLVTGKLIVE